MSTNYDEFKRSLDALVSQAQQTAQLGLDVARDQVETLVRNPNLTNLNTGNLNEQMDEVRRNLQTMAREMETRAQELVHLASTYMQNRPTSGFGAPTGTGAQSQATTEPPSENESATAAGAGTSQDAGSHTEADQTPVGEAPKQ
jgi:ElaB/YqjD/DUF883 family membrane-anchored ribosome-binding protein